MPVHAEQVALGNNPTSVYTHVQTCSHSTARVILPRQVCTHGTLQEAHLTVLIEAMHCLACFTVLPPVKFAYCNPGCSTANESPFTVGIDVVCTVLNKELRML